jgi:hypothetical protein
VTWGHREVDIRGRLGRFNLSIDESTLQVNDVLPQGVVF